MRSHTFLCSCSPSSMRPPKFTKQSDQQPSAFAAGVEQSHHNTDSYITRTKSLEVFHGQSGCWASPSRQHRFRRHSGTEHHAALVHICWSKTDEFAFVYEASWKKCWVVRRSPSGSNSHHWLYASSCQAIRVTNMKADPVDVGQIERILQHKKPSPEKNTKNLLPSKHWKHTTQWQMFFLG